VQPYRLEALKARRKRKPLEQRIVATIIGVAEAEA
jgi:hypothetical protein